MNYALIGCGRISPNHIAAAQNNGLTIVALCDTDPAAMQKLIDRFGLAGVRCYRSHEAMLREFTPELAAVATPSGSHAAIALDCLRAGCNVIIEKPVAMTLEEADELIEAARCRHLVACACHQNRFNKSIQKLRGALESGRFGRLYYGVATVRWNRGQDYYQQAPWRGTKAQDGGALMNQCIHNIDLLRWMMGDGVGAVCAVTANLAHPYIEMEDLGLAVMRFKNGGYGLIEGTTDVYPKNLEETLAIFGERGTVKAGGGSVNLLEEWRFGDGLDDAEEVKSRFCEAPKGVYGFGHTPLYRDVIDAIRQGREPYIPLEAGRRALELVLAIYRAAETGGWVKLPL
ncbi:Gfo/Idh/MocA family oxidoreductase [Clostridiaceae bacterium NSJ-31]|uniref:Gfo/Idh/MocA family oxidoreductase n=2 Tax=Ligaoa zhengdingensis TaxID=2763658 RepID=A0A926DYV2_9FIRM|nr:Gfo/Idh/MocA family oxidoreductase [Ligaoa zhengdingensis]MBC8547366.1 Gfo/Idh/MocA family oxidoreductase [Ligaoa zhengdingensis]